MRLWNAVSFVVGLMWPLSRGDVQLEQTTPLIGRDERRRFCCVVLVECRRNVPLSRLGRSPQCPHEVHPLRCKLASRVRDTRVRQHVQLLLTDRSPP